MNSQSNVQIGDGNYNVQNSGKKSVLFDKDNCTIDDKRKYLENIIAMGEDIRGALKRQIDDLELGIGTRHVNLRERKDQVLGWLQVTTKELEWIFDTRLHASKFSHFYKIPVDSFISPTVTVIQSMSDIEQLRDLDKTVKKGTIKLEAMLKDLQPREMKEHVSKSGVVVYGDKVVGGFKAGHDVNIGSSKDGKKNYFWEIIIAVIGAVGVIVAAIVALQK